MNDIKVPPFTDGQKEVIEVTEHIANGKLICDVDDDIDVLTNEEWLRSATTEQLAEWMALRLNQGILLALRMKYHCDGVDAVREWLKEKHD